MVCGDVLHDPYRTARTGTSPLDRFSRLVDRVSIGRGKHYGDLLTPERPLEQPLDELCDDFKALRDSFFERNRYEILIEDGER